MSNKIDRRRVVKAAAWSAPVLVVATPAVAAAATQGNVSLTSSNNSWGQTSSGTVTLSVVGAPLAGGSNVTFSFTATDIKGGTVNGQPFTGTSMTVPVPAGTSATFNWTLTRSNNGNPKTISMTATWSAGSSGFGDSNPGDNITTASGSY